MAYQWTIVGLSAMTTFSGSEGGSEQSRMEPDFDTGWPDLSNGHCCLITGILVPEAG
jgi:hypothetical protein